MIPDFGYQNKYPTQATVVLSPPTCRNGLWPTCFPCWIFFFLPRQRSAIVKACNVLQTLQGHRSSVSRGMQQLKPRVPFWLKGFCFWYTFSSFYTQQGTHRFRDDQQLDELSVNIWEIKIYAKDETRPCATLFHIAFAARKLYLSRVQNWAASQTQKVGAMYFSI